MSYRPAPLPERAAAARPPSLDLPRLRVAAAELHHPLLQPIVLDLLDGLNPEQAAVLAVLLNPELRATRDARGEAQAQLVIAGLLPNPELNVELTHPSGGDGTPLVSTSAASLAFDVGALRTRSARRAAADAELAQVDLGIAWQEWLVAQDARLLATRLAWLRHRLGVVREEIGVEAATELALERAMAGGDATLSQVGTQRLALGTFQRAARELEQTENEAHAGLLALLGRPPGLRLEFATPREPPDIPPSDADGTAPACLDRRLDLIALRRGYDAQEARMRLAVLEQFPSVSIGLAAQNNESAVRFLGGFVTLALPVFDSHRAAIRLEDATRARLRHEFEARALAARGGMAAAGKLIDLLQNQRSAARQAIAPLADLETRQRDAASRSDLDRLTYQATRSALVEQKLEAIALSQALDEAHVALATACGGDVKIPGGGDLK